MILARLRRAGAARRESVDEAEALSGVVGMKVLCFRLRMRNERCPRFHQAGAIITRVPPKNHIMLQIAV